MYIGESRKNSGMVIHSCVFFSPLILFSIYMRMRGGGGCYNIDPMAIPGIQQEGLRGLCRPEHVTVLPPHTQKENTHSSPAAGLSEADHDSQKDFIWVAVHLFNCFWVTVY